MRHEKTIRRLLENWNYKELEKKLRIKIKNGQTAEGIKSAFIYVLNDLPELKDCDKWEKMTRIEAIKDIKILNRNRSSNTKYSKEELTGIVKYIMGKFNIEEEDIK